MTQNCFQKYSRNGMNLLVPVNHLKWCFHSGVPTSVTDRF
jgi:hypothetical protein